MSHNRMTRSLVLGLLLVLALTLTACGETPPPSVSYLVVAEGYTETDFSAEPVNPGTEFSEGIGELTAIIKVAYPTEETRLQVVWYGYEADGTEVVVSDNNSAAPEEAEEWTQWYTVTVPGGFVAADYLVEVYLNGELADSVEFTVVP